MPARQHYIDLALDTLDQRIQKLAENGTEKAHIHVSDLSELMEVPDATVRKHNVPNYLDLKLEGVEWIRRKGLYIEVEEYAEARGLET